MTELYYEPEEKIAFEHNVNSGDNYGCKKTGG